MYKAQQQLREGCEVGGQAMLVWVGRGKVKGVVEDHKWNIDRYL